MKTFKKTITEALILGGIGLIVALGVNATRDSGSVKLTKNYFAKRPVAPGAQTTPFGTDLRQPELDPPAAPTSETGSALEHSYQAVTFEQAAAIFNDPNTEMGVNVFIDARNDDAYKEGHIPDALQAYHYEIERYIDNVMLYAEGAEKVVIYCNGGNCEDSIFVSNDLLEAGISYDSLYLFEEGWKAWTANNMPVETGRIEEADGE